MPIPSFSPVPSHTLLCSLCGREIPLESEYWVCNGSCICSLCLGDYARAELAPCREIRGKEYHL